MKCTTFCRCLVAFEVYVRGAGRGRPEPGARGGQVSAVTGDGGTRGTGREPRPESNIAQHFKCELALEAIPNEASSVF